MPFDIYAGGFARFFAREWENVAQRHARDQGLKYDIIYPRGLSGVMEWDVVQAKVKTWREAMMAALGKNAPAKLEWSEEPSAPYFTDRPGWDGYSALVVLAACEVCDRELPRHVADDALESAVVHDARATGRSLQLTKAQLWIPGPFKSSFDFTDLNDAPTHIGSVTQLVCELDRLANKYRLLESIPNDHARETADMPTFRNIAADGLARFQAVARQAMKHRLPMMLSY